MKDEKFEPSLRLSSADSVLYAADCAEHVMYVFENHGSSALMAKAATEAARKYANGKINIAEVEKAACNAVAAAEKLSEKKQSYAIKACAKAAETAYNPQSLQLCCDLAVQAADNEIAESEWQYERYIEYLSAK